MIYKKYLSSLDINDVFFNSLKIDYSNFTTWFNNHSNRYCYVTYDNNNITSLMIFKYENIYEDYSFFSREMKVLNRIKICTLKVNDKDNRIASKYMNIILDEALNNDIHEIYITLLDKHKDLISFLDKYNFKYYCNINNTNELVYIKEV